MVVDVRHVLRSRCDVPERRLPTDHRERWTWVAEPEVALKDRIRVLERTLEELKSKVEWFAPTGVFIFPLPAGISRKELEEVKLKVIAELDRGSGMYPSDFAKKYGVDLRLVLAAFSELERDGEIELSAPVE